MRAAAFIMLACLVLMAGCEEKVEKPKAVGAIEITVEPDPVVVTATPSDYTIKVTWEETGGVAVDISKATVEVTYLDDTHIMLLEEDLTVTRLTWEAKSPEEGGPLTSLLERFWHFDAGEKEVFEFPIKIGAAMTAPEGFVGLYFSVIYITGAIGQGKSGFKVSLTYEGIDANGNSIIGSLHLRLQFQE